MRVRPDSLAVIGLGAVGRRLAQRWSQGGLRVSSYSPSAESRARARAAGLEVHDQLSKAVSGASTVVLCVRDNQLPGAIAQLSNLEGQGPGPERVWLHTSGSRDSSVLAPLGGAVGVLHPLAAFAPGGPGPELADAWCAVGGDEIARARAGDLVRALGAHALELNQSQHSSARYHAAATLLSNGMVALTAVALDQARGACADPEQARLALIELLRSTLANLEVNTPARALTGVVSRADVETIGRHLLALADQPESAELYRALSRQMLALAVSDGRLSSAEASAVERALSDR